MYSSSITIIIFTRIPHGKATTNITGDTCMVVSAWHCNILIWEGFQIRLKFVSLAQAQIPCIIWCGGILYNWLWMIIIWDSIIKAYYCTLGSVQDDRHFPNPNLWISNWLKYISVYMITKQSSTNETYHKIAPHTCHHGVLRKSSYFKSRYFDSWRLNYTYILQ